MKPKTNCIIFALYTSFLACFLAGCGFSNGLAAPSESLPIESEVLETETSETELLEITTEENTEIAEEIILPPLSYNDQVVLDFVETPVKRTREEAIEKLRELARWYPALYFVVENEALYSNGLLISGSGNPEMTDFLYGYLTAEPVVTGGFTDEEQPEDHPLFLQFDVRWGYSKYGNTGNMASSGCGPTCLSMVTFYLTGDRTCTPDAIASYSMDHGHYVSGAGTAWTLMTEYPASKGLSSYQIYYSESNLKKALDSGRYLICSVRPGDFTSSGHFIVIYGYDENGFKINDPKCVYRSNLTWTYDQIRDDIKGCWSIGK